MVRKIKSIVACLLIVMILFGTSSIIISAASTSNSLSYVIVDEYTIGNKKYSVAEISRDYNELKAGTLFYLDSDGTVVIDEEIYTKLTKIYMVLQIASTSKKALKEHKENMQCYYDVYKAIHLSEKVGTIAAKGTYLSLTVLAKEPFSILDASLDIASELINPEPAIYNSIFLIYSQNAIIYADKGLSFTDEDLKKYENAMSFIEYWDHSYASTNVVREIAKDDLTEASSTNALKEIGKYFKNVLVGLAEEFLGSFKIADYIYKATSTLVDIGGLIVDMGIASEYDEYYSNGLRKRFDKNFEISDNVKNIAKYINGSDDTLEEKLPSETIATGIYNIKNVSASLMMNVYAGKNADKTNVVTWANDGTVDQKFYVQHVGNGKYLIYAVCSASGSSYKRCLDVYTGSANVLPKAGDNINIFTRSSMYNDAQYFYIKSVGDGKYVIECCSVSGLVVTASSPTKNNGNVCVNKYTGSAAQKWTFELVKNDNSESSNGGNSSTLEWSGNTNATISTKMNQVLTTYKPGKSYFTKNGSACASCHSNNSFSCVDSPSACNCLRYVTINGKKVDLLAVQCFGYARYWQQILFGSHEKNSSNFKEIAGVSGTLTAANTKVWFTNNKSVLHPGTHIRVYNSKPANGHSIVLLNVDYNAGTVTYIDCNWSGRCAVGNITTLTWAKFASKFGTLHYASVYKDYYTKYPNTQANKLTVSYNANGGVIGKTYKVIDSVGLRVRSGPGTNYDRIGLYKVNTTFIVTEYKKMSDYTWGKVFYDGQYGWVAVNSEWIKEITSTYSVASSMVCKGGNTTAFEHQLTYGVVSDTGVYNHTTFGLYKEGAGFLGWSTSPDGSAEIFDADRALRPEEIVPALANGDKSVTLYAIWDDMESRTTYSVIYDANGGIGVPESQTKEKGTDLTLSHNVPTREGYIFMGWSTDISSVEATYQPSDVYANDANIVMYAIWKPDATKILLNSKVTVALEADQTKYYSFTPSVNGKYVIYSFVSEDSIVFLYDSDFNEIYADDDGGEGSNFYLEYDFVSGETYIFGVRFCDTEIAAELNFGFGKLYTILFDANGGSNAPSAETKVYDVALTLPSAIPTKAGYSFMGWSTSNDATVEYQAGATYSANANVTLYAVWSANEYTVSYNANGGSNAPASQTKIYETALMLSDIIPVKTGYKFIGWATSNDATSAIYSAGDNYTNNADVILYAVWQEDVTVEDSDNNTDDEIITDKENTDNNTNTENKETTGNKETVNNSETTDNKETVTDKETVVDENDNVSDEENEDSEKSGCNSSMALSALLLVGSIGVAFACKKKKED